MSEIKIKQVRSKKDLKEFIYLPKEVHKDNKQWLPPLYSDEWILYDPEKNKSFDYCEHITFIALKNDKPAGRIMGLINERYNEIKKEEHGRFCFFETINDNNVSHALIKAVEDWAREKGMKKIVGPIAFSDKDPQGVQIEGFEHSTVLAAPNNAKYLGGLIENEGYTKKLDLVSYIADIPDEIPEIYKRVLSRVALKPEYKIIEFTTKKEMKPYILDILQVMNDTYSHIYGFVPMTDEEKNDFAKRYMLILEPAFIKAFAINDKLVGFVIAMPDIAEGIRKAGGRLFPFGFIPILRSLRKSTNLLMLLGAVLEEHRGIGVDAILGAKILESATNSRMTTLDSHLILEYNTRMHAAYERIGGKVAKRFRIYQKDL